MRLLKFCVASVLLLFRWAVLTLAGVLESKPPPELAQETAQETAQEPEPEPPRKPPKLDTPLLGKPTEPPPEPPREPPPEPPALAFSPPPTPRAYWLGKPIEELTDKRLYNIVEAIKRGVWKTTGAPVDIAFPVVLALRQEYDKRKIPKRRILQIEACNRQWEEKEARKLKRERIKAEARARRAQENRERRLYHGLY